MNTIKADLEEGRRLLHKAIKEKDFELYKQFVGNFDSKNEFEKDCIRLEFDNLINPIEDPNEFLTDRFTKLLSLAVEHGLDTNELIKKYVAGMKESI